MNQHSTHKSRLNSVLVVSSLVLTAVLITAASIGCGSATSSSGSTGSTGSTGTTGTTGSTGTTAWTGGGDGVWRRNAVYAETFTFDPCNAHQPGGGEYHYHDNPVCLRYQMNDNINGTNVGTATAAYTESTGTLHHSPILGYAYDGYPVYGPYGYGTATNSGSTVRRMVSSYALRTDNTTTRTSLPAWAQTYQGITTLTSSQYGPNVSTTYPLGRYVEDYAYTAGSGDLDQFNGRYCVTPDYPSGTYAYFVTIDSSGNPAFPYYLGPQFAGVVNGGNVTSISGTTTTYYTNHAYVTTGTTAQTIINWLLKYTSQYAQILYYSSGAVVGPVTTWTNGTNTVSTPTFADIQTIQYSSTYVYLSMSGLASHMMGPWYNNTAKTAAFINLPSNQNAIAKIPLTPTAASGTYTQTVGGAQGRWANGVSMFNMLDFFSWSYTSQADVGP